MSDKKQLSGWKKFLHSMTKAHDLGSEEEIMTDHDYDGIKELDNVLPPWWKYGFYITIAIGFFTIYRSLPILKNTVRKRNTHCGRKGKTRS